MEGSFSMIKNYAPQIHKKYEDNYYSRASASEPKKGRSLLTRPMSMPPELNPNNPIDLMQEYFNSVRKKRDMFRDGKYRT